MRIDRADLDPDSMRVERAGPTPERGYGRGRSSTMRAHRRTEIGTGGADAVIEWSWTRHDDEPLDDAPDGATAGDRHRSLFERLFGRPEDIGVVVDGNELIAAPHLIGDEYRRRRAGGASGGGEILQTRPRGSLEEIRVTVLAHPSLVAAGATDELGARAGRRLHVDVQTMRTERHDLAWDASLRTRWRRQRRATLRLYGSSSANVTILTLTPKRPRRTPARSFIRHGLAEMHRLGADLAIRVEPAARVEPAIGVEPASRVEPAAQGRPSRPPLDRVS